MLPVGINQARSDPSIEVGPMAGYADLGVYLLPTLEGGVPRKSKKAKKETGKKRSCYHRILQRRKRVQIKEVEIMNHNFNPPNILPFSKLFAKVKLHQ